jgi:hypothetical protein
LLREDWQHASVLLMGAGWMTLVGSLMIAAPQLALVSALIWGVGVAVVLANHVRMVVLGRTSQPSPTMVAGAS